MSVASGAPANELPFPDSGPVKKRNPAPRRKDDDGTVIQAGKKLCPGSSGSKNAGKTMDDEKRAAAMRHARDRRFSKDGTAPKLSKEQRERKRMINRLSAQRKREKERYQLDTLTDQYSKLNYLNATLEADNSRLEKLKDQLRLLLLVQGQGDSNQGVSVKLDTLDRVRKAVVLCAEESAPSKATIYDACSSVEQEANWPVSPFLKTTEALKEKLTVLETSKGVLMNESRSAPSSTTTNARVSSAREASSVLANHPSAQTGLQSLAGGVVNDSGTKSLQALLDGRSTELGRGNDHGEASFLAQQITAPGPVGGDARSTLESLLRGRDRPVAAAAATSGSLPPTSALEALMRGSVSAADSNANFPPASTLEALMRGSASTADSSALASASAILRGAPAARAAEQDVAPTAVLEKLLRGEESIRQSPAGFGDLAHAAKIQALLRGAGSGPSTSPQETVLQSLMGRTSGTSLGRSGLQGSFVAGTPGAQRPVSDLVRSISQGRGSAADAESLLALSSIRGSASLQDPTLLALQRASAAQTLLGTQTHLPPPTSSVLPTVSGLAQQQTTRQHQSQNEDMLKLLQGAFRN